jgi:integrase
MGIFNDKKKDQDIVLKVNKLQNRYVTDGNIWTVDETFFSEKISLFLVINLKTRAILGYVLGHQVVTDHYVAELYKTILDNYHVGQSPLIIHSDLKTEYTGPEVKKVFAEENIEVSSAIGDRHQNQVSETINDKIKALVVLELFIKETRGLKALIKIQPANFKGKTQVSKSRSSEYRKWIFSSDFFHLNAFVTIQNAIQTYNKQEFTSGMSREHAEFYNTKIRGKTPENVHLVASKDELANRVKKTNIEEFKLVEQKLAKILSEESDVSDKLLSIESLLLEGQNSTQEMLRYGFTGLASQNSELLANNERLSDQLIDIQNKFEVVVEELSLVRKDREYKAALKKARAERKRLPKRQPMTPDIYQSLIEAVEGKAYKFARLRIAFCLLAVTGIRVSELLPLKVSQIETLLSSHWIAINRSKRGPSSHKAFLTPEGKRIVKKRRKDFELIVLMKEVDSYIFTPDYDHNQMLRRESITKSVNKVMKQVSKQLPNEPNMTSHSFRSGYITQLWKDTSDIEFVRQAIGHITVESTSSYVESLPDEERQERMSRVKSPKDLIINQEEL